MTRASLALLLSTVAWPCLAAPIVEPPSVPTLSTAVNPILSPETSQSPSTAIAQYLGAPLVQGWTDTVPTTGGGVYSQMITDNVTIPATGAVHYGLEEMSLSVLGTGTATNELNVIKFGLTISAGITSTSIIEPIESSVANYGSLVGGNSFVTSFINGPTGTMTGSLAQIALNWGNQNTAANSVSAYTGLSCTPMSGGGAAPTYEFSNCISNQDPTQVISTSGSIAFKTTGTNPAVTGCGTSCSGPSSYNSDMSGVITEGTSATGFTMTFLITKTFRAPNCPVWPMNAAAAAVYSAAGWTVTPGQSTLVVSHASASGAKFGYLCFEN